MKYRYDKKLGKVVEKPEPQKEVVDFLVPNLNTAEWQEMWSKPFDKPELL